MIITRFLVFVFLITASLFSKPVYGGSLTISTTQPNTTASLTATADMASCPDKEIRSVYQFDITSQTLNDKGTMIGNAPPVVDLRESKIESLTIGGKTITNFPLVAKVDRGYSYKIDPPINFGPNDKAVIRLNNVKTALSGRSKVWFLLIHNNGNPMPCITGEATITVGASKSTNPLPSPTITPAPTLSITPISISPTKEDRSVATSSSSNNITNINPKPAFITYITMPFVWVKNSLLSLFELLGITKN